MTWQIFHFHIRLGTTVGLKTLLLRRNQRRRDSVPPQSVRPSCRPHFATGTERITHHQKILFIPPVRSFAGNKVELLLSGKLLRDTRSWLENAYSQNLCKPEKCTSKRNQMLSLGIVALKAAICEWVSAVDGHLQPVVSFFMASSFVLEMEIDEETPLPIKKVSLSLLFCI